MKQLPRFLPSAAPSFLIAGFLTTNLVFFTGCTELNNPNRSYGDPYRSDPYYQGSYDSGRYYDRDRRDDARDRRDVERERARLEDERRRLESERRAPAPYYPPQPGYRAQPAQERCPSGFSPSENKCSAEERRHGCKDMRLPGGLGCVHR